MIPLFIGAEEVDYDVDTEEYINEIVDECCECRVLVDKGHLEGHNSRSIAE